MKNNYFRQIENYMMNSAQDEIRSQSLNHTKNEIKIIKTFERSRRMHFIITEILDYSSSSLKILDFGCGFGDVTIGLSKYNNYNLTGFDTDIKSIHLAKFGNNEFKSSCTFTNNIKELGSGYDLIIFNNVIEHMHNPGKSFNLIRNILKDEGLLLLTTPNRLFPRNPHTHAWFTSWTDDELYTFWSLKSVLKKNSFLIEKDITRDVLKNAEKLYTDTFHSRKEMFFAKTITLLPFSKFIIKCIASSFYLICKPMRLQKNV